MSNLYQDITLLSTTRTIISNNVPMSTIHPLFELSNYRYPNLAEWYRQWHLHYSEPSMVKLHLYDFDLPIQFQYYSVILTSQNSSNSFSIPEVALYSSDLSSKLLELLDASGNFTDSVLSLVECHVTPVEYLNCKVVRNVGLNAYLMLRRDAYWSRAGINDYDINEFPNCWNQYSVSSDDLDKYRGVLMDVVLMHRW